MRKRNLIAAIAVSTAIAAGTTACTDLVAGDSLVVQAATTTTGNPTAYGVRASTVEGVALKGYSGAAPCDYKSFIASDYNQYRPGKVSLAFSGNNMSPCMARATGTAYLGKYHDDLAWLTNFLTAKGVKVIYSAPVCQKPGGTWANGSPELRAMEAGLASRFRAQGKHVAYSDSAALTICPGWNFVGAYRVADGLHLSPLGAQIYAAALRFESKHVTP